MFSNFVSFVLALFLFVLAPYETSIGRLSPFAKLNMLLGLGKLKDPFGGKMKYKYLLSSINRDEEV